MGWLLNTSRSGFVPLLKLHGPPGKLRPEAFVSPTHIDVLFKYTFIRFRLPVLSQKMVIVAILRAEPIWLYIVQVTSLLAVSSIFPLWYTVQANGVADGVGEPVGVRVGVGVLVFVGVPVGVGVSEGVEV